MHTQQGRNQSKHLIIIGVVKGCINLNAHGKGVINYIFVALIYECQNETVLALNHVGWFSSPTARFGWYLVLVSSKLNNHLFVVVREIGGVCTE